MDKKKIQLKGHIVYPDRISDQPETVVVDGSYIASVGENTKIPSSAGDIVYDFEDAYICPGFVDLHVHGAGGADAMDGTPQALGRLAQVLAEGGTTAFLATTMAAPQEDLVRALTNVASYMELQAQQKPQGACLLGSHLEGPFINCEKKGAQRGDFLLLPDVEELKTYLAAAGGSLKMLTLAPELPDAIEVIEFAKTHGLLVSIGHSNASLDQVRTAVEAGLSHATHTFNAMGGFHHREPGTVGAILGLDSLTTDFIPDGLHIHPDVIKILFGIKGPDLICAITDCIRAGQMPDGDYELGGNTVQVRRGVARLPDGTIAGSTLTMARAVGVLVESVGLLLHQAVNLCSANPARILGLDSKGRLIPGKDADIVVLDGQFRVLMTMVRGEIVFN